MSAVPLGKALTGAHYAIQAVDSFTEFAQTAKDSLTGYLAIVDGG